MPIKKSAIYSLPMPVEEQLGLLGKHLQLARKRRSMTIAELATRMLVDEKTVRRLEKGEPGVGIGVLANALFCLGLLSHFEEIASPGNDTQGQLIEQERLNKRQRVRNKNAGPDMNF